MEVMRDVCSLYAKSGVERILSLNKNVPDAIRSAVSRKVGSNRRDATIEYDEIVLFVVKDTHREIVGGKQLLKKTNVDLFRTVVPSLSQQSIRGTRIAPSLSFSYSHNITVPVHFALDLDICDERHVDKLPRQGIGTQLCSTLDQLGERLTHLLVASLCQPNVARDGHKGVNAMATLQRCHLVPHISQRTAHGGVHILWTGGAMNFDTMLKIRSYIASSVNSWLADDLNLRIDTGASGTLVPGSSKTGLHDDVYKDITTGFSDPTLPWCPGTSCCPNSAHYGALLTPSVDTLCMYLATAAEDFWCQKTCPLFLSPPSSPPSGCATDYHPKYTEPCRATNPSLGNINSLGYGSMGSFNAFCREAEAIGIRLPSLQASISLLERGDALWMWEAVLHNHLFSYLRNKAFRGYTDDHIMKTNSYCDYNCDRLLPNRNDLRHPSSPNNVSLPASCPANEKCDNFDDFSDESDAGNPFEDAEDDVGGLQRNPASSWIESQKESERLPSLNITLNSTTCSAEPQCVSTDRWAKSLHEPAVGEALVSRVLDAMALIARAVVVSPSYRNIVLQNDRGDSAVRVANDDTGTRDNTIRVNTFDSVHRIVGTESHTVAHAARLVESWITGYDGGGSVDDGVEPESGARENTALVLWVRRKLSQWYECSSAYPALPKTGGIEELVGIYSLINLVLNLPESTEDDEKYSVRSTHADVQISLNKLAVKICDLYIKQNPQEISAKYEMFVDLLFTLLFPVVEIPDQERELMWLRSGLWVAASVHKFGAIATSTLGQLHRLKICTSHPKTGEPVATLLFTRILPTLKQMFEKSKAIWQGLTTVQSPMPNELLLAANNQYFSLVSRQVHYCSIFHVYNDWANGLGVPLEAIQEAVDNVNVVWKLFSYLISNGYQPERSPVTSTGSGVGHGTSADGTSGVRPSDDGFSVRRAVFDAAGIGKLEPTTEAYLKTIFKGFHYIWEIFRHPLPRDSLDDSVAYDNEITCARIRFVVSHLATIIFRRNPKFIWFLYSSLPNTAKSTFLMILRELLGERYASLTATNISRGGTAGDLKRPDLINLSYRFAYGVDEIPTGLSDDKRTEIDNEIIRQITGDMTTSGYRDLRKNNSGKKIKFCGALFIACNQLPAFKTDVALNERLVFTQFENTFSRKTNVDLKERVTKFMVPALLAFTLADYYMRLSVDATDKGPDHEKGIAFYKEILKEGPVEDFLSFDRTLHWVTRGQGDVTLLELTARVDRFAMSRPDCTHSCKDILLEQLKDRGHYDPELDLFECLATQAVHEQVSGKGRRKKQKAAAFDGRQPLPRDQSEGTNSRASWKASPGQPNSPQNTQDTGATYNAAQGQKRSFDWL